MLGHAGGVSALAQKHGSSSHSCFGPGLLQVCPWVPSASAPGEAVAVLVESQRPPTLPPTPALETPGWPRVAGLGVLGAVPCAERVGGVG